jgi:hypothetical protein
VRWVDFKKGKQRMKTMLLSTAAVAALTASVYATESAPGESGVVSGEVRAFYILRERSYRDSSADYTEQAFAVGGNLGYEKKDYGIEGLSTGVRFYTSQPVGEQGDTTGEDQINLTLFKDATGEGYSILGEAYVNYATDNTNVKVGRQALSTPLAGGDDARMLPTLFEAAVVSNSDITNTTLIAAHVAKVAYGTFANAYANGLDQSDGNKALTTSAGYGLNREVGRFQNMGEAAVGEGTTGVDAVAAIYHNKEIGLKLQVWDYMAADILSAVYAEANYDLALGENKLFAGVQSISETGNGDKLVGKVASNYTGAKIGGSFGPVTAYVAASRTGADTDAAFNGGIITPWGGMPAYTQGMVTRHMFLADTEAAKVAATYKSGKLKATLAHVTFDMGKKNGYSAGYEWTATENMADIIYMMDKSLMLRYRLNMPDNFFESATNDVSWTEHRFIVSYTF